MIGIFLLYWIGKSYYELAHEYDRSRWGYAILGVVTYYGGTFLGAFVIGILAEAGLVGSIENMNNLLLSILTLPMGLLCCWLVYKLLKNRWSKNQLPVETDVIDQDLMK